MAVEVKWIAWGACQLLFLNLTMAVDTTAQDWLWKSWTPSLSSWTPENATAELYWPGRGLSASPGWRRGAWDIIRCPTRDLARQPSVRGCEVKPQVGRADSHERGRMVWRY